MSQFHNTEWWEEELKRMLAEQQPEDLHLDYKEKRSLLPRGRGGGGIDNQKRGQDISKDVSSFLNREGGVLIYGVPEDENPDSTGGAPVPSGDDIGFQRDEISKETIEHLITSNIKPRPGPELFRVIEVPHGNDGRLIYVVEVGVGIGDVWQAKDQKYYRRYQFKAEPMDHDEINMVRDRSLGPYLKLTFGLDDRWTDRMHHWYPTDTASRGVEIHIGIQNLANGVADSALIDLALFAVAEGHSWDNIYQNQFPVGVFPPEFKKVGIRRVQCHDEDDPILSSQRLLVALGHLSWNGTNQALSGTYAPLFKTADPWPVTRVNIGTPRQMQGPFAYCFWRVQAPRMQPKLGVAKIGVGWAGSQHIEDLFIENKEMPWEFTSL